MIKYKNIGYVASSFVEDQQINLLKEKYNLIDITENPNSSIDLLVVMGGDGLMLHSLHSYVIQCCRNIPVYGINYGTVGFLLNRYSDNDLITLINNAVSTKLLLLKMTAFDINGIQYNAIAINEISLLRNTHQAANLKIKINNKLVMKQLISDGVLVASPAGSTAYNFSAGGPILPLNSNIISLTAINPFRPRRWRGALLPNNAIVEIEVLNPEIRLVNAVADYTEFHNIKNVTIQKVHNLDITLLFDPHNKLEERIITEQFLF
ncbi:NAD kinase [Neoehrlichia mikurensis]|uniref:NAD kinase n=1 Tax=Neoehrlichia mikurensis TaxID=89586 RepID=A0A9Q9F5F6_9RICK|nr:NAD kinase [Neoehrlichia mikurensis]QXK91678.1 NAD kinase [Neoehrlichia mikurensis]QXK92889.1 NAD kinase [Neoehrlichia mikurensis]QXK93369.1 NAD kinase [Neoehrlichia mikurensis]UTO55686.1 NAD kinase [Neoehrlichia mikurensis]UTO56604.1 NAD kinase [Neoehrlichia mikurensis]